MIEKYPIYINNKKVTDISRYSDSNYLSIGVEGGSVLEDGCAISTGYLNLYNNRIEIYEEYGGLGVYPGSYSIYIEDINIDEWLKQCFNSGIKNMTWQQYIDSEYNIYNFKNSVAYFNGPKVITADYGDPLRLNGNYVYPTDTIQSFTHYTIG